MSAISHSKVNIVIKKQTNKKKIKQQKVDQSLKKKKQYKHHKGLNISLVKSAFV